MLPREYAREAYKRGLAYEAKVGVNPFKFGIIGSTDAHTSLSTTQEDNFFGKVEVLAPSADPDRFYEVVAGRFPSPDGKDIKQYAWQTSAAGLAAVWARGNTREALWDAMARKEVYATTGTRLLVRVFAGFDFTAKDLERSDFAEQGYQKGVPMGGDLKSAPAGKGPGLIIRALRDVDGANLDRIQVIKGWLDASGKMHEKVYDAAWSSPDKRKRGRDGKIPVVGNTVNVKDASYTNAIGAPALEVYWRGPVVQSARARVLLRAGHRDSDAALDDVRRQVLRHEDPCGSSHVHPGTCFHDAHLVHAGPMKRLLTEPLLHFLVLGAALFAAYAVMSKGGASEPARIVVTQGRIESMATQFARTWQRPPTDAELQGLIRGYIREEVLYREGLALGLDRDDQTIRRRVAQKLEFVADSAEAVEPSDQDLQAWLDSHRERFSSEARFAFRQIYLDPKRHPETLVADAQKMLAELNRPRGGRDAADLGDPTLLPPMLENASVSDVAKIFGGEFAAAVAKLAPGRWQGPLESAFGVHLVQVIDRTEARAPELAEVREAVKREWERARRVEASEMLYRRLLARYSVTVEGARLAQRAVQPEAQ